LPESVRTHRVDGRLEAVVDGRAVGWAWSPERPEETVEVEVLVDGEMVVSGAADVERPALLQAGVGHGRYGFDIPLPERFSGAGAHAIQAVGGPDREPLVALADFETTVREPSAAWARTRFTPMAGRVAAVVEDEPPPDPGAAALVGSDGWLFLHDEANLSLEQLSGGPLLEAGAVRRCRDEVAERHRRLCELRIPYLFAVAPLKERLYGKFLPSGLVLETRQPVRQVNAALCDVNGGDVVDLLPALRAGRRAARVFPRTDSKWSDRGAFFAYRVLMKEAGKRLIDLDEPLLPEEGRFLSRAGFCGDLAEKPKLAFVDGGLAPLEEDDGPWEEEIEVADVSDLRALRMPAPEHLEVTPSQAPRLYEIADAADLPRAVLVGDVSCLPLIQWLAEHFSRFVFLCAAEPPLETIELEMPDIVIHVVSERLLVSAP
jgi:acetyltransferase AlgX (SGNH hydrolase-like protein)